MLLHGSGRDNLNCFMFSDWHQRCFCKLMSASSWLYFKVFTLWIFYGVVYTGEKKCTEISPFKTIQLKPSLLQSVDSMKIANWVLLRFHTVGLNLPMKVGISKCMCAKGLIMVWTLFDLTMWALMLLKFPPCKRVCLPSSPAEPSPSQPLELGNLICNKSALQYK